MEIILTDNLTECNRVDCPNTTYWRVRWDETQPLHPLCAGHIGL